MDSVQFSDWHANSAYEQTKKFETYLAYFALAVGLVVVAFL